MLLKSYCCISDEAVYRVLLVVGDISNDLRSTSIAALRLKAREHSVSSMGLGGIFSPYGK